MFSALSTVRAVHIVGGEMTYQYLGGEDYLFTLKVYRDCFGGGADFDPSAPIGVFDGDNNFVTSFYMSSPTIGNLDTDVDFGCANVVAPVCVEEGVYTSVFSLPANATGYWVAYQRCCRNGTIVNLAVPGDMGATYAAFVPPIQSVGPNSSPSFIGFPPVGICMDIPFAYDHSAIDIDGDSLAYSFCTPYHGGSIAQPSPDPPSAPLWPTINWGAGYSAQDPIDANPGFTIDPQTGQITGTPTQQGQYVVGVCVKEFRNGVEISEIRRDFQFNIVLCPDLVLSSYSNSSGSQQLCAGTSIQFENNSVNSSEFLWDFGNGQTSTEFEPEFTFNEEGVFEVSLISEPNTQCPDTASSIFTVSLMPLLDLGTPQLNCPEGTYDIPVTVVQGNPVNFNWTTDPNVLLPANTMTTIQDLEITAPGLYDIAVETDNGLGCSSENSMQILVPAHPEALIEQIDDPCLGLEIGFQNSTTNAVEYLWNFGDPNNPALSDDFQPIHEYAEAGTYTVTLTASAPGTCESESTMTFEVNPVVLANFDSPDAQCQEGNVFDFQAEGQFGPSATFNWDFEGAGESNSSIPTPTGISFESAGAWPVTLTITEGPCTATFTDFIETVDEVDVDFVTDGFGCQPLTVFIEDITSGGAGNLYSWDFGDGAISNFSGSVSHVYEHPGEYTVSLTVESTIACPGEDTEVKEGIITVLPTPVAAFTLEPQSAFIDEPIVTLSSEAFGADSTIYLIEGEGLVTGEQVTHEFNEGGEFEITQVVYNEVGCEARLTRFFTVNGHLFYAPNAITMNGDGLNDFFKPVVVGDIDDYELRIYDRWGGVIFQTEDVNMPWVPDYAHVGTYVYDIILRDRNSVAKSYRGSFTLIR